MVSINLSADATTATVNASTDQPESASFGFNWTVDNGNWSVNPAHTDANGSGSASSSTSLETSAGGVGGVTVEVIVYNAGGLNIDQGTGSTQIGPF